MLTALLFVPLVGGLISLFLPKENKGLVRGFALLVSLVPWALLLWMAFSFDYSNPGLQFVERYQWIPAVGVQYLLGIDGISLSLLALTAFVVTLSVWASFGIQERVPAFMSLMLILETAIFGVFTAQDYILFFVFWEAVLVPMYFLIGIWGGPRREYAAHKFLIYTMAGSVFMLLGFLALFFNAGLGTFEIQAIAAKGNFPTSVQLWTFLAFFLGFGVKVPIFPFHTWLPTAHVEAPTGVSMILAGVLLKMGAYGFYRIAFPTLPDAAAAFSWVLALLGVINIVYGAVVGLGQRDVKRLVAYSSINHMGFVVLALAAMTPASLNAGLYQMISHGIISPMLFFYVASVIYDRTHTRQMDEMGGLYNKMPMAASLLAFAIFANLGLPGLSGFVGEFLTVLGSFERFSTLTTVAAAGLIVAAGANLWMIYRVLQGQGKNEDHLTDLSGRELAISLPMVLLIVALGSFPLPLLQLFNPATQQLLARMGGM